MKYSLLLDNNIYRPLVQSENGTVLKNFNSAIKEHRIINKIPASNINYSLTPFSIMEALGITIPDPKNSISKKLTSKNDYHIIFESIKNEAEIYYKNLKQISKQEILKKAKIQSEFTVPESKNIEKTFIQDPIQIESFYEYFIQALVFDYMCKYEFSGQIQKSILSEYLIPEFFMNENITSRFSKFRIIKRLWDNSYHELEKSSKFPEGYIKSLNNSMKLKRNKDFLDCEIIHFSCVGDCVDGKFNPVFSFTSDDKKTVINRIIVYKSMINLFLRNISEEYYNIKEPIINGWKQGMITFCNKDGTFIESVDISDIEVI